MNTAFWTNYIPDSTIKAICWTLIHSLWIGMAIALLAGLVITLTRRSAADLRYRLLCSVLVLFVLAVGVTFYIEWDSSRPVVVSGNKVHSASQGQIYLYAVGPVRAPENQSLLNQAIGFLNQHTNIIFLVWLLFFMLKSMKMAGGLLYIQRIRNYKVYAVSDELTHKIDLFASRIGIRQTISLVQSELVKVPVAVGWLKPVILLPMGIVLQLSTEQLESILWHELAHIRRRDYLVNILQGIVEAVFFFNPGLLWLSSLIRTEREACCDDMVLSRMNRKANYLEALLAFGYEDASRTNLAMSIGSGNQLRDRLKRMINQENKRLSMAEKVVLIAGLVLLCVFTTMPKISIAAKRLASTFTKHQQSKTIKPSGDALAKKKQVMIATRQYVKSDTTIKADTSILLKSVLFNKNNADLANCDMRAKDSVGNVYHMIVTNNKLTSLEINDKKVSDDQLRSYDFLVRQINREIVEKRRVIRDDDAKAKANETYVKTQERDAMERKLAQKYANLLNADMKDDPEKYKKIKALREKMLSDTGLDATEKQYLMNTYLDDAKARSPQAKMKIGSPDDIQQQKKLAQMDMMQREKVLIKQGSKFYQPAPGMMKSEAMRQRAHDDSISYGADLKRAQNVIADLVKEKVVYKAADVKWFGLSETELIVNGKKQPDALQQKLKAKYAIRKDYGLYYGPIEMTGTGVFIDVEARSRNEQRQKLMQDRQMMKRQIGSPQLFKSEYPDLATQQRFKISRGEDRIAYDSQTHLQPVIANVIDDLVSENIVKDKNDLSSFKLTNTFLTVNGKKQSDELHDKLKAKYLIHPRYITDGLSIINDPQYGLHYDKNGSMGIGISIDKDDPK